jgi:hypothetical protein
VCSFLSHSYTTLPESALAAVVKWTLLFLTSFLGPKQNHSAPKWMAGARLCLIFYSVSRAPQHRHTLRIGYKLLDYPPLATYVLVTYFHKLHSPHLETTFPYATTHHFIIMRISGKISTPSVHPYPTTDLHTLFIPFVDLQYHHFMRAFTNFSEKITHSLHPFTCMLMDIHTSFSPTLQTTSYHSIRLPVFYEFFVSNSLYALLTFITVQNNKLY